MKTSKLCLILSTALLTILLSTPLAASAKGWKAINVFYGGGDPNNQRSWGFSLHWLPQRFEWRYASLYFLGLFSRPYVHDHGKQYLYTLGVGPVLRLTFAKDWPVNPYFEGSIGLGYISKRHVGFRDLGSHFNFQDILGLGVTFGSRQQFEVAYRYMHYSNAGLAHPNGGLDFKWIINIAYHFATS